MATALLLLLGLVGAPLVLLAGAAVDQGLGTVWETLGTGELRSALWHTLSLAGVVTGVSLLAGGGLALLFDRALVRRPLAWRLALLVPLFVPQFTLTLSWTQAYGPGGLSDQLLGITLPGLYGPLGIALLLAVDATPLAWLIVSAGLAVRREPDLVRAARASGATGWQTLRTVDLPLLRSPLLAAAAVVFVGVVNSFAVPEVLGAAQGYQTLATLVYQQLSLSAEPADFARLCVISLLMVLLVLLVLGGADRGFGRVAAGTARSGQAGTAFTHVRSAGSVLVAVALTGYVVLSTLGPLLALVAVSVTRAPGLLPVPANWTTANYVAGLEGPGATALARTVGLAATAAVVVTVLAALVVGIGGEARRRLGTAVTVGFAIPGTALAVGVLVAYGGWLGGSALIILVAYLAKAWALGYRALTAGVDRIPPELARAARASGADPVTVLRTVTAPLMYAGLVASAGLVALFALHELTMSSILYGPRTATFAVVVLNQQQLGDVGASAAMSLLLTLPMVLVAGLSAAAVIVRERSLRLGRGAR